MALTPESRALLIHTAAYVAVNAGLFVLNATQTPEPGETREWWVVWVVAGWGIGLAAHAFAVWAEGRARAGQLLADPHVRGVAVHLFIYLAVNTLLVVVNLTTSPNTLWSIWPILIWGVALAGHAYLVYRAMLRKTVERYATEQEILTRIQLERHAAEIAAAVALVETDEAPVPAGEAEPAEGPAPKPKRKRAAAKTTRRTTRKAPRKKASGSTTRSAAKKTTRTKRTTTRTAKAKKPATRRGVRKPASKTGEKG